MIDYGQDLFKGSAGYYAKYRPLYPSGLVRFLVNRFGLDGEGELLDLGCGTGQLALRFADWVQRVTGLDYEQEMINEAVRISKELRALNTEWVAGKAEEYLALSTFPVYRLVTIAKAFHWMDRDLVLELLYNRVAPGGGVAIVDQYKPDQAPLPWQKEVNRIVRKWYGEERKAGNTTYSHPLKSHTDIVAGSSFRLETHRLSVYEYQWTIEAILGNLYSTSFGSKRFLGDRVPLFERELEERLLLLDPKGVFTEGIHTNIILAVK